MARRNNYKWRNYSFVVIAHKIDLKGQISNSVPSVKGNEFAKRIRDEFLKNTYDVPFVETSAKRGEVIPSKSIIIPSNVNPENFYSIFWQKIKEPLKSW